MNLEELRKRVEAKKYVIFDFDGTIVDLRYNWNDWQTEVEKTILEFKPDFVPPLGSPLVYSLNEFTREYGNSFKDRIQELTERFELGKLQSYQPIDKTLTILKEITGKELFIWSGNCRKLVMKISTEVGVVSKFKKIVSRDEVQLVKPDPEGFKYIYETETKLEDYILVGDNYRDEGAAEGAGIEVVLINT